MRRSPRASTLLPPLAAWLLAVAATGCATLRDDTSRTLSRVAFGSCVRQAEAQPIWKAVIESRPDLFLLLGDNIYADTVDMEVMRAKYEMLGKRPGYRKLLETCPVLATWDDHDYGVNDGGAEYPKKQEAKELFLEFFDEPLDSPRRSREGVYLARTYGPPGRRVQVVLLDTRWFRSPLILRPERKEQQTKFLKNPDPDATILGEAQWAWLEETLAEPAELRLVCSSIQMLVDGQRGENWLNFPHELQRFLEVLRRTNASGVIILSGDSHYAELSKFDPAAFYSLLDLTSSSLNQGWENDGRELPNRNRVAGYFPGDNFGMVEIDWEAEEPVVRLSIRDVEGKPAIEHEVLLSELRNF